MKRDIWLRSLLVLPLALQACGPTVEPPALRPDDAGDESFVRQVVPILQGRKVRGYDEVKALTDLIQATDRETVVRALMEDEEFVSHWSEVLVNHLRIHRNGVKSQAACYGSPLLGGAPTSALAEFVLTKTPSIDFGSDFNMSDVVRSALVLDNLYPIYRAHLFPMETKSDGFGEQARRDDLGGTFGRVYLNRELGCLLCHNSDYSLSGDGSGWNRTYPIAGSFETALYGAPSGTTPEQAFAIFRTDAVFGPQKPWGIESCGTFDTSVGNDPQNVFAYFAGPLGKQVSIRNLAEILHFGYGDLDQNGLDRSLPLTEQEQCDFCVTSCDGVSVSPDAPLTAVNAAQVKTLLVTTCGVGGCHAPASDSGGLSISNDNQWFTDLVSVPASVDGETRVIAGNAANSYLIKKLRGSPGISGSQMPQGGDPLLEPQIELIENWIDDIPSGAACNACDELDCSEPFPKRVEGHEAFAFLVAARVVENVWEEVMGHPLTIANYFPRNEDQQRLLWNLTEFHFVPNEWSLKELLVRILTSDYFNREAPRFSTGTTAYELPLIYDPWVEADPRIPPVSDPGYDPEDHPESHNNSMGEGVYRYTARGLFNSTHRALGWPEPARFPSGAGYANADLQLAMGQFFNDNQSGSKAVDFQGLLTWESVHGVCEKPSGVASDWIDLVMADVASFPPADPGGPLTLEDLVVLFRDWLLGDGRLGSTSPEGLTVSEADDLTGFFGMPLSTEASSVSDLEAKLRGYCGVLVETPQFLLAGIEPKGMGPEPRLRVCTSGPCTYQQVCNDLKPAIEDQLADSSTLTCNAGSLGVDLGFTIEPVVAELCPRGVCSVLPIEVEKSCLRDPRGCPRVPPACDPRAAGAEFCGAPARSTRVESGELLLAWADGARVTSSRGVQVLYAGHHRFTGLEQGAALREGDLLAIPPTGELTVSTPSGSFGTASRRDDDAATRFLLVTGPKALASRRTERTAELPRQSIARDHARGWLQWGEAGRPLRPEEREGYVGPEEELLSRPAQDRPGVQQ